MAIAAPAPRHADALGHAAGDELLQAFDRRIQSALRAGDTLARFGEDQLAILSLNRVTRSRITAVTERLRRALLRPFVLTDVDH